MSSPAPQLRSPEFWLFRTLPLRRVLPVLVVAAGLAYVAEVCAPQWWVPVAAATAAVVIGLVPVHGNSIAKRIGQGIAYRWQAAGNRSAAASGAPFDVPLPGGGSCGMRWDGDCLITMLRIDAQPRTVTRLSPTGLLADDMLPLPMIARCLDQFDIDLATIDIVSTGSRSAGTGAVARIYESVLGPLPAVAHRTVWVVLRLDPLANAEAAHRRGGGAGGALRSAIVATRRMANRLAVHGLHAAALSAAEMTSAALQLTLGVGIGEFTETSRSVVHDGMHHTSYRMTPAALGPRGIAAVWSTPTVATTITVRLQRAGSGAARTAAAAPVAVTATARFVTRDAPVRVQAPGLLPLHGKQWRAMLFSLPLGAGAATLPLDGYLGAPDALADVPMPITGCGQLIGADDSGQGVALPLVGSHVRRVEIVGSVLMAKQVILRAIALGAHVVVHTDRHEVWRPMLAQIADEQALTLAARPAGSQQANSYRLATMVVYDGLTPATHHSDATVLVLRRNGSVADGFEPNVTLVESPDTANLVTVHTNSGATPVYMVATPEELAYVGAPVGVPA
ncbi:type VII secretion protein EccE [Nocardia sp. BMG111209]|uniref:type VII secretion protein EccE n=1 Tax=Nocardia sp. BMG111209 TaxID=1160137 RepID=UPI00035DC7A9|nr:type VII secretion protein EccE [Nocardia sp. BMG111209]